MPSLTRVYPQGKDEYLGVSTTKPVVRLDIKATPQPRLQWFDITRYGKYGGELLAAFELLFLVSLGVWVREVGDDDEDLI